MEESGPLPHFFVAQELARSSLWKDPSGVLAQEVLANEPVGRDQPHLDTPTPPMPCNVLRALLIFMLAQPEGLL